MRIVHCSPGRLRSTASLFALLLYVVAPAPAQEEQPLSTDRPGFGTGTAAVQRFQLETGYTFGETGEVREQSIGQVLLRIPFATRLEFRLAPNSYVVQDAPSGGESGFEDANLGFKANIAHGAEQFDLLRPSAAFLLDTTVPTGESAFGVESLQPKATLALGWPLPQGFGLGSDVNVQSLDTGENRTTEFSGGATLSYAIGPSLGAFVEWYGFAPQDQPAATYFDGGFTYLLSNNLQLDVNGGVGLSDAAQDFFVGFGLARRF